MVPRSAAHSRGSAPVCLFLMAGHVKEVSPGRYTWPRPWHVGHGTGIWPLPRQGAHMFETGPLA
jgi:hypothetical protein